MLHSGGGDSWEGEEGSSQAHSVLSQLLAAAGSRVAFGLALTAVTALQPFNGLLPKAHARKKAPPPPSRDIESTVDQIMTVAWPMLSNLGFSGALGAMAGIAFKVRRY